MISNLLLPRSFDPDCHGTCVCVILQQSVRWYSKITTSTCTCSTACAYSCIIGHCGVALGFLLWHLGSSWGTWGPPVALGLLLWHLGSSWGTSASPGALGLLMWHWQFLCVVYSNSSYVFLCTLVQFHSKQCMPSLKCASVYKRCFTPYTVTYTPVYVPNHYTKTV